MSGSGKWSPVVSIHSATRPSSCGGFYRNFFAVLKSGAGRTGGGLERLFITGVSPITMDDVTSGFNIGKNISLHPDFSPPASSGASRCNTGQLARCAAIIASCA